MNSITQLTAAQLRKAASLKEAIAKIEKQLSAMLGAPATAGKTSATKPAKKKRTMSAAVRRKIAAAQKARWAKVKAAKKA